MFPFLALCVSIAIVKPPQFDIWHNHLPYRATWGRYNIIVEHDHSDDSGRPLRLRILDQRHRTLRIVRAWAITSVSQVHLLKGTPPELDVSLWTGGAYASFTEVYFTQKRGLRNLLVFDGDSLGVKEVTDLSGDGVPEIVTENPVLLDFS